MLSPTFNKGNFMALDEIVLTFAAFIFVGLILVVMVSLLSSLRNKKNQQGYTLSNQPEEFVYDEFVPQYFPNENNVINIDYDKSQLELPFQGESNNPLTRANDDEFLRYTKNRKRYTVINPPAINTRKVSNFY